MGAPALTSRGFTEDDFRQVADFVDRSAAPEHLLFCEFRLVGHCKPKSINSWGQLKRVSLCGSYLRCHAAVQCLHVDPRLYNGRFLVSICHAEATSAYDCKKSKVMPFLNETLA